MFPYQDAVLREAWRLFPDRDKPENWAWQADFEPTLLRWKRAIYKWTSNWPSNDQTRLGRLRVAPEQAAFLHLVRRCQLERQMVRGDYYRPRKKDLLHNRAIWFYDCQRQSARDGLMTVGATLRFIEELHKPYTDPFVGLEPLVNSLPRLTTEAIRGFYAEQVCSLVKFFDFVQSHLRKEKEINEQAFTVNGSLDGGRLTVFLFVNHVLLTLEFHRSVFGRSDFDSPTRSTLNLRREIIGAVEVGGRTVTIPIRGNRTHYSAQPSIRILADDEDQARRLQDYIEELRR